MKKLSLCYAHTGNRRIDVTSTHSVYMVWSNQETKHPDNYTHEKALIKYFLLACCDKSSRNFSIPPMSQTFICHARSVHNRDNPGSSQFLFIGYLSCCENCAFFY